MKFSEQIKTSKTDEYYTPDYAVKIILPYLKDRGFKHVWCPFDKEHSEFVKILKEEGFDVTFGHIETGQDFFNYKQPPTDVDCVVSNPPFSKRTAIFEALFSFNLPFAMIMNSNGLFDAKARYELFKNNKFELLIPKGRMCFFDESMEAKNSPNFQSIYVCSGILENQIEFSDMGKIRDVDTSERIALEKSQRAWQFNEELKNDEKGDDRWLIIKGKLLSMI